MNFNTTPDYRSQAEKCIEWAERATDAETELYMAQAYRSFAAAQLEDPHPVWGDASLLEFNRGDSLTRH